jgi:phytoene/squalene synthetase
MGGDLEIDTSYCFSEIAKLDRDRYLTILAAPARQRDALVVLAAFNLELARVADTVSEQMLGFIRLQWWREALDEIEQGRPVRRHAVATPLAQIQRAYDLPIAWLQQMVEAREQDIAQAGSGAGETQAAVDAYLDATSGNLIRLSLLIGGLKPQDRMVTEGARLAGIAYGLTGLIRACLFHARHKRLMLPSEVLRRHGVNIDHLFDLRRDLQREGHLAAAIRDLAGHAGQQLTALRQLRPPRRAVPGLLPAKLAALQLDRLRRYDYDLFDYRSIDGQPIDIWRLLIARYLGRI